MARASVAASIAALLFTAFVLLQLSFNSFDTSIVLDIFRSRPTDDGSSKKDADYLLGVGKADITGSDLRHPI